VGQYSCRKSFFVSALVIDHQRIYLKQFNAKSVRRRRPEVLDLFSSKAVRQLIKELDLHVQSGTHLLAVAIFDRIKAKTFSSMP